MLRERIGLFAFGLMDAILQRRKALMAFSATVVLALFAVIWVGAYSDDDYREYGYDYYEDYEECDEGYYDDEKDDVDYYYDEKCDVDYYYDKEQDGTYDEYDCNYEYEEKEDCNEFYYVCECEEEYCECEDENAVLGVVAFAAFSEIYVIDFPDLQTQMQNDQRGTFVLPYTFTIPLNQTLNLGPGVTIRIQGTGRHFDVQGILNIEGGIILGNNDGIGGTFDRNPQHTGGGIVINGGTVNMTDGAIRRNDHSAASSVFEGGGVLIRSGTFNMSGGVIELNHSTGGGGVRVDGLIGPSTFNMSGGFIRYNNWTHDGRVLPADQGGPGEGGGVLVIYGGIFDMSGGIISGNMALNGSGVYVHGRGYDSRFYMSRGEIFNNGSLSSSNGLAVGNGGGVHLMEANMIMSGTAVIRDNYAAQGGGIFAEDSHLTFSNGTISGNVATGQAGGIRIRDSVFVMVNGIIENKCYYVVWRWYFSYRKH